MGGDEDQTIPADEFARWPLLSSILGRTQARMGHNSQTEIVSRLSSGLLKAAAEDSFSTINGHKQAMPGYYRVSPNVWSYVANFEYLNLDPLWETNTVVAKVGTVKFEHYGVRVEPAGILKMLPELVPMTPPAPPPEKLPVMAMGPPDAAPLPRGKQLGGAPPKDVWEAVWVDIAARLINGDFDPKQQKDVQVAIEEWGIANNEPISESTAKRHAKLLWQKVKQRS